VGAAASGFAMRVENEDFDIREFMAEACTRQLPLDAFDGESRWNLTHETTGIGKAGLYRYATACTHDVPVFRNREQYVEEAGCALQR
jgi:hypothetical protein